MFDIIVENGISLATAIMTLFVIVNPLGNIPLFVSLTNKMNENQRKNVFNTASIVAFVLLLMFAFTGKEIFSVFGISIYSFQISGGILLLIIAIRIIVTGRVLELDDSPESVGAVPIAMPLLVGPGAITTTIFNVQTYGLIIAILSVLIVLLVTWIILRYTKSINQFLGTIGALVISRLSALLIAAIAVQYILLGISFFNNIP